MADDPAKAERGHKGRRRDRAEPRDDKQRDERPRGGPRPDSRPRRPDRNEAPLTAGLFAGVADREMPCRVGGCENTWTWYGHQQIRSLGKPEPKRMCDEHLAEFEGIGDKQMPCRNSWCTNTWLWTRFAQLRALEHEGKVRPPHRLCESCFAEERATEDAEVPCKIPECHNTWTWPRMAQIKHRAWVRRQLAQDEAEERVAGQPADAADDHPHDDATTLAVEADATSEAEERGEDRVAEATEAGEAREQAVEAEASPLVEDSGEDEASTAGTQADEAPHKRRRRKRKRKRKISEGPPERLCERCLERLGHLEGIELPCKVHGCHGTWTWDREGQLRAWSSLDGQTEVTELPQPPRRMCNSCVEFVRKQGDREVRCGRPGCGKTWTYKTGAQLQDHLAGRTQDPIRLCDDCIRSQFVSNDASLPTGSEIMPCQVGGCTGTWVYMPGMKLETIDPESGELSLDRMCDSCRAAKDAPARDPRRGGRVAESVPRAEPEQAPEQAEPSTDVDLEPGPV